ncbi:28S ribosomal protein S35, mitochondrial-like [Centruroides sculpturatus]|uniref:28S ribosomal protein S35, mitochondrial-like n=1 Tax=Centruroides sculpturatus TaxID=218467 RepID=UPI000C6ED64F|nr:28S ribosomal protein S35, mitochondrial-like [Centruroides sculpturatus]
MDTKFRLLLNISRSSNRKFSYFYKRTNLLGYSTEAASDQPKNDEEFRKFELSKKVERSRRRQQTTQKIPTPPPRYLRLPTDAPWMNVWPMAQSFRPSVVPLPLRQGYVEKGAPPGKFANAELMKIPNFLHLTPPAIKKHCEAIKKFCTKWPEKLETDEICDKYFPLEFITSDYCYSSPSIREPKARIVTLKIKLSSLTLDYHARDKLLRLVGERYDPNTDMLTLVAERCPLRQQNKDYVIYLLTALFYESWKTEPWEAEKTEADMEKFFWENSLSQKKIIELVSCVKEYDKKNKSEEDSYIKSLPNEYDKRDVLVLNEVKSYEKAILELKNEGEDEMTLKQYREAVVNLINLKTLPKKEIGHCNIQNTEK